MKKVYVCSPLHGDVEKNLVNAKKYCSIVSEDEEIPIAPHLYFSEFLDDDYEEERLLGIRMGLEMLKVCDEVKVFGNDISEGMNLEIRKAEELRIPITFYDKEGRKIDHDTAELDTRLSQKLRSTIKRADRALENNGWFFGIFKKA